MKYSRIILILSLISVVGLFCACKSGETLEYSGEAEINHLVPETEFTIEKLIESTQHLCASVQDSYSKMLELASAQDASDKGIEAAKAVEEKYGERIKELSEIDFTKLNKDELENYSYELSNLITAIREARDALTL